MKLFFEIIILQKMQMSKMSGNAGLDPFQIAQDVVSDKEMLAVWGPKCSPHGFHYRVKQDWICEIKKLYSKVYGTEVVKNNTICESFARSFLAHKKGYSIDWERFSVRVEERRNCSYGNKNPCWSKKKRPFRGYISPSKVYSTNKKMRHGSRSRRNSALSDHGAQNRVNEESILVACDTDYQTYVKQINSVIQQLNSRIKGLQQLKAGYEERHQNLKESLKSYSSVCQNAAETVKMCRSHIDELKAEIRNRSNLFAERVGEFCSLLQSGHNEEDLKEMITKEYATVECIGKANLDLDACQKKFQENTLLEQTCKKMSDEQATELEKMALQILRADAAIDEIRGALSVQEKYRQHLEKLPICSEVKLAKYLVSPLPIYHPVLENSDALTVINVSPCPVCNLYFDSKTLDIIVASCTHTFHPFCLVSNGKFLSQCPKCLCPLDDMWLKSFGIVRKRSHLQIKSTKENASALRRTRQAPMEILSAAESRMESLPRSSSDAGLSNEEETLAEMGAKLCRINALLNKF